MSLLAVRISLLDVRNALSVTLEEYEPATAVFLHTSKLIDLRERQGTLAVLLGQQLNETIETFLLTYCDTVVVSVLDNLVDNDRREELFELTVM